LPDVLTVHALTGGYGKKQVLHGIDLSIASGEVLAIVGHNGAGKSTLLKTIFGLLPVWSGQITLDGRILNGHTPAQLLRRGVTYVPQGNRVFSDLSVQENLEITGIALGEKARLSAGIEKALRMFPVLGERMRQRAETLSGGEKQMLALANALVLAPRVLLLDEPSLGLAPSLARQALARIREISSETGAAALIVEQKVRDVLKIADRVCVLRAGCVSHTGPAEDLLTNEAKLRQVYL